ncbi:MAG: S1-like domain-containing RNA-binding protein [Saprospiraceae bacterium]
MIKIGEYQTLTIDRELPQGFYLVDTEEEENDVLMPRAYLTDDMAIGDEIVVFVYCDSYGREIATTERPVLTVGEFAALTVKKTNEVGAFCDWGTSKELLIPYANQAEKLEEGKMYVVHMYLDDYSDRLVGTTKLNKFLKQEADEYLKMGQEVNLLVYKSTEIGYKVVVNETYSGLIYKNDLRHNLIIGQALIGYIKPIRSDNKVDISLNPIGYESVGANENNILKRLEGSDGFLPYHDKSDPESIRKEFGISKKLYKKIVGSLYKQKRIIIKEDGIYLIDEKQSQHDVY